MTKKQLRKKLKRAKAQIDELLTRLEANYAYTIKRGKMVRIKVEPGDMPDAIDCRDMTIQILDRRIDELKHQLEQAKAKS